MQNKPPIQLTVCLKFDTEAQREAWKQANINSKGEGSLALEQQLVNLITRIPDEMDKFDRFHVAHIRGDFQKALNKEV